MKIPRVVLLLVLLPLFVVSADLSSEIPGATVALELAISEGNPRNSEGDFVKLRDGRLLFIYTRFSGGGSDHDRANLVSRFSKDGGKSWSGEDKVVVANEGGLNVMSVSLLRLQDGRIALFYLEKNSLTDCRPVLRISSDEAETWGELTSIIPDKETGYYVLNNDRVFQLRGGRLLLPVALHHAPDREKPDWDGEVGCYYSDDAGATWKSPGKMRKAFDPSGKRVATQEPGVIELSDGRVLLWVRTGAGELYHCHSGDHGLTWTDLKPMGVASPQSPATIERIPGTGTLVMVWNDHTKLPPAERKLRTPLGVALSRDDGASWSGARNLESDPKGWYCYTAMEFTDESLLLAYVSGKQAPGLHLSSSRITRLPLSSLDY